MGRRFVDTRFDDAVALYLAIWPQVKREAAVETVRHMVREHGIRFVTRGLQADWAQRAPKENKDEDLGTQ